MVLFLIFTGVGKKKKVPTGIPGLIDDCYFTLMGKDEKSWSAQCQTCSKVIKGGLNVSSNLVRHLAQLHPEVHELYKTEFRPKQATALGINNPLPTEMHITEQVPTGGVPRLIDNCYFTLISQDEKSWSANCKTCGTVLRGRLGVSSNLIRHLVRLHPEVHALYRAEFHPLQNDTFVEVDKIEPSLSEVDQ